jgi:hypothetical protein
MNGAMAELWAKIMRHPSSSKTNSIGNIHQSFWCQKNAISSAIMGNFDNKAFICNLLVLFLDHVVAENQHIDTAAAKGAIGFARCIDNRLAFEIERRIQYNRHASGLANLID